MCAYIFTSPIGTQYDRALSVAGATLILSREPGTFDTLAAHFTP